MSESGLPLVLIVGPTAVGKTELAVRLAARVGGEIVGADSRQVYRRMDVGTAKPSAAERLAIPHHLIDVVEPDQDFDAGTFLGVALAAIAEVRSRGQVPFVVGGSGFYVRALTQGLPDLPRPDEAIRAELEDARSRVGSEGLHAELARLDEVTARRLHPNDAVRVLRALEVCRQTSSPLSSFVAVPPDLGPWLRVSVDRPKAELETRIEARVAAMWEAGFVEEVERLRHQGFGRDTKSMNAIGYRQVLDHLDFGVEAEQARAEIALVTRQYVRRQRAWFRPEPGEPLHHPERDYEAIAVKIDHAAWRGAVST